jgi:hypothetical protein
LTIHPTFLPDAPNAGTVLVMVEGQSFFVHRDVLVFASSFFEALLSGDWRETAQSETSTQCNDAHAGSPPRRGSVHRTSSDPGPLAGTLLEESIMSTETSTDSYHAVDNAQHALPAVEVLAVETPRSTTPTPGRTSHLQPRDDRMAFATRMAQASDNWTLASSTSFAQQVEDAGIEVLDAPEPTEDAIQPARRKLDARIRLSEERATTFQDLLFFIYPHTELQCTWVNVEPLLHMSRKFDIPLLARQCVAFLLSSAAGRSIAARRFCKLTSENS